jgi:hypothetical protein
MGSIPLTRGSVYISYLHCGFRPFGHEGRSEGITQMKHEMQALNAKARGAGLAVVRGSRKRTSSRDRFGAESGIQSDATVQRLNSIDVEGSGKSRANSARICC